MLRKIYVGIVRDWGWYFIRMFLGNYINSVRSMHVLQPMVL